MLKDFITKEEVIQITKDLVSIEGHKDIEVKESKVAQYIQELLKKEKIENDVDIIEENRPNVYGKIQGEDDEIELMFNGHLDTIPGFNMDYEAFEPFIKDGKLYGRGSADMKGGIAAMISALIAMKRSNASLKKTVMFAGVIDEEESSKGTERLIKKGIIPKMAVIGEPTELNISIAHKGMEWIEITFKGRSSHGSRPKEGINAIYAASEFNRLVYEEFSEKLENRTFDLLGHGTVNVGVIRGGDDPNIIPDKCSVRIDRRWLPNETLESVHGELEELAKRAVDKIGGKYEIRALREFTASMINTPHSIDRDHRLVKEALESTEKFTGDKKEPVAFPAWSDAALLSNNGDTEAIILGPGNINQAHANDEFCDTEEIYQAAEIYFDLIEKICK
ncbi:M20 family metallopeptidase [Clostridium sp. D2Q-11]|uniref:M20 family metallopeptidase n=1 Tax=Anaeromonas frigoriresistens TaxID=2683708 RepID=A0A942Z653_9FIRM|nr:M20 family metallopeptidase [Anaeromonas frigoriresistens]MBS4538131.1 M20 family metallopeptidase [Anaeromonas frigoriresistens]